MNQQVVVYGHRGAKGYAPENTIPGFRMAMEMGADGFEFDIHQTADRFLVVMHDDNIDRTTGGHGGIGELTLRTFRNLDAGRKFGEKWAGLRPPTVEEVLLEFPTALKKIELKHSSKIYPGIESRLLDLLDSTGSKSQSKITSFDYDALENVRKYDSVIECAIIARGKVRWFLDIAKALHANWLNIPVDMLEPEDVTLAVNSGLKVGAWGLTDEELVSRAIAAGVEEITSDYPDIAVRVVREFKLQRH